MFAVTWVVLLSCTGIALRRSVCVSHAFMCVDDWSVFRCAKIVLQIRKVQLFVVTMVCDSDTVLIVAKKLSPKEGPQASWNALAGIPADGNGIPAGPYEAPAKPLAGAWPGMWAWPGASGDMGAAQPQW